MAGLNEILNESFETTAGKKSLREMIGGERVTVFIAYPMDFTPVCTRQLCSYRDHWPEMAGLACRWWGINQASPEKHERFKREKQLPFELISDPEGTLLKALGLWGWLRTKRGFAVVAPSGEILGTSSIFPFFYRRWDEVIQFVESLLAS